MGFQFALMFCPCILFVQLTTAPILSRCCLPIVPPTGSSNPVIGAMTVWFGAPGCLVPPLLVLGSTVHCIASSHTPLAASDTRWSACKGAALSIGRVQVNQAAACYRAQCAEASMHARTDTAVLECEWGQHAGAMCTSSWLPCIC